MQALQKKQKTWALLLLGALLGLAAFLCLYGTAPLDPANDAWIWYGYDETDIHQHYAGWLGFRNSSWQFPLAQADALAYPAGTGVNISFTDSLPWVSVLFKLLAPVLPAQFQWFGLYELAAFILQSMAAALVLGLFLYDLLPLAAGTALFAFSPIMIERAFRHVALSSHYIVLFALYAYLRGRREQRCFMPVFWLLAALGVGITPYFLPMTAIFALLLAVENALHTRKLLAPCGLFLGTCAAGYAAGVVLGSLNNGYSASRENYGVFSFNLNALFNPSSKGGYTWSRILPARPQLYGQYDGFNYLGFGMLALLGVLCAAAVVLAVRSKAGRAALAGLLHDCAKGMPLSQMTKAAKNEKLDPVMKESKALMHAVAGAHVAQDVYDVHDPEVLGAIRWHTTGHANMTKLEKIVYLADMIEPNRKPYPGLEALRKLCMTDLDEAMHMALLMSLDHVREQGKPLHPDTMAALAEYEPGLV